MRSSEQSPVKIEMFMTCMTWLRVLLLRLLLLHRCGASHRDLIASAAIRPLSPPRLCFNEASTSYPTFRVAFPPNHSYWRVDPHSSKLTGFSVRLELIGGFQIPRDGFVVINGPKFTREHLHVNSIMTVTSSSLEPGSHFWELELWRWGRAQHQLVAQESLHFEVVVPQDPSVAHWMHPMAKHETWPLELTNTTALRLNASSKRQPPPPAGRAFPVCFVTGVSSIHDGQKTIWLQIMRALSQRPDRYKLIVKTFERVNQAVPWAQALRALNVAIDGQPLIVPEADAELYSITKPNQMDALLVESIEQAFPQLRNASMALEPHWPELDDNQLSVIQPPFVARVWQLMVGHFRSCRGGVLTFGNSRMENDRVTLYTARLAGVRAVVEELPNLHPLPLAVDALVAPSHFALHHPSVSHTRALAKGSYVCNAGVDTDLFSPSETENDPRASLVIGYVGRLSTDKSIGILVQAARYLVSECPACRVRIIGDGTIEDLLMKLADEWQLLGTAVEFIDGIYGDQNALVHQLRQLDVYVSSRMDETLGIAPLEAMSVGIPVVGFASGGVGEYLRHGYNGLALSEPTPQAVSDAIVTLYKDTQLRKTLGENARQTVLERFSQPQQIQKYTNLYERLVHTSALY